MIAVVLLAWALLSVPVALLVGRALKRGDSRDPLADQPVECLSPAEVDRRIALLEREWAL